MLERNPKTSDNIEAASERSDPTGLALGDEVDISRTRGSVPPSFLSVHEYSHNPS
jgi:hypothetical protein